jgi:hypothetical protein
MMAPILMKSKIPEESSFQDPAKLCEVFIQLHFKDGKINQKKLLLSRVPINVEMIRIRTEKAAFVIIRVFNIDSSIIEY